MTRDYERRALYTTLLPVLALTLVGLVGCGGTPVKAASQQRSPRTTPELDDKKSEK